MVAISDGLPDLTRKAREILRVGATRIKFAEGACVDLIVFDGNPLENPDFVSDAEPNFDPTTKIGVIYQNTLQ